VSKLCSGLCLLQLAWRVKGVPTLSSLPDFLGVGFAPLVHGDEDGLQGLAQRRQEVFHPRRHFRVDLPPDEAVRLQLPQLLSERSVRNAGQGPVQFAEPFHSFEKVVNDQYFPAPVDHGERCLNRATYRLFVHLVT
jgi:hypothetical protein